MGPLERIADRCLGLLGLFLIGAISWGADHLGPVGRPGPEVRVRMTLPHNATPERAGRPAVHLPTTLCARG